MAQIILNIPDAVVSRVTDAFASLYGYDASQGTKATFAKKIVTTYIMDNVKDYESRQAVTDAKTAAVSKVASEIVIT